MYKKANEAYLTSCPLHVLWAASKLRLHSARCSVVNFTNILQTGFLCWFLFAKKLQRQMENTKEHRKILSSKNLLVKCWWQWNLITDPLLDKSVTDLPGEDARIFWLVSVHSLFDLRRRQLRLCPADYARPDWSGFLVSESRSHLMKNIE